MTPRAERCTFYTLAGAFAARTRNTQGATEFCSRYCSAIRCLRSPALQKMTGHAVRGRPGLDAPGEPARHPHQVRVIQLVVTAVQRRHQHRNPPGL